MRIACIPRRRMLLSMLFIGSHFALSGCTDESKTSGTMVEVSDEAKAFVKSKRENYRGGPQKDKVKPSNQKKK
jgi:hypothetical protein